MQYSIVNFSGLEGYALRIDADYYQPLYLEEDKRVQKFKLLALGEFSYITDGQHGYHEVDTASNISHLTAKNAKNWFADKIDADPLAKWVDDKNKRSSLKENDLILSTRGTVGFCAIVKEDVLPANIDQDVARIFVKSTNYISPETLISYINSKYGQDWIARNSSGMVQQGLSLDKLRKMPIPAFKDELQLQVRNVIQKSYDKKLESENYYRKAQTLLLSELGLLNWQSKHRLTFVKHYSDTQETDRIDAEYFQPKYEEIIKAIKSYSGGWDTLGNLCELVGHPSNPPYADSDDKDKTFIVTQKHLGDYSLTDDFWKDEDALYTTQEFINKNKQYILTQRDVLLYSVGAYIGKANIYSEDIKATIGSFLTLLRTKKQKLNPYYLMAFLNTNVGIMISKQHQRGMAQQYLYPYDIRTFPIPLLTNEIQTRIQQKITESFNLRKQSKHLLECAKRAVEIAIEKDEAAATEWLKQQEESTR